MTTTTYRTASVDGLKVFYREAGDPQAPVVLLLHGFPTSSHMFRELIPALADRYHVVAPDLPGFGYTEAPDRATFKYSFDHLAQVVDRFTEVLGLRRYAIYVFDYGAPIGFRLALRHPERITAVISQNGNAYLEGLSEGFNPIQAYWNEIQLDLFGDYQSNIALYAKFQDYLRTRRPPLLAVWGKNDPFFLPPGAQAFERDQPDAEIHLLDAGHFALESQGPQIAGIIRDFLARKLTKQALAA